MLATTTIVAAAFGFNIFEELSKIVRQDEYTKTDIDRFTFHHNGEFKQYDSVDDMITIENLNILYPTKWPEGIVLTDVRISKEINGNDVVYFITNNPNTGLNIELCAKIFESENVDVIKYKDIDFYISNHDNAVISYCHYQGNTYYFSATSREDLILIIENLKEN